MGVEHIDKIQLAISDRIKNSSLLKATNKVLDKLEIENKTFTKITGAARRLERRMIDKTALREAFINALFTTIIPARFRHWSKYFPIGR